MRNIFTIFTVLMIIGSTFSSCTSEAEKQKELAQEKALNDLESSMLQIQAIPSTRDLENYDPAAINFKADDSAAIEQQVSIISKKTGMPLNSKHLRSENIAFYSSNADELLVASHLARLHNPTAGMNILQKGKYFVTSSIGLITELIDDGEYLLAGMMSILMTAGVIGYSFLGYLFLRWIISFFRQSEPEVEEADIALN